MGIWALKRRNRGIKNVTARSRFEDILRNLHFPDNIKGDKGDKGYRVRSLINHFSRGFSNSISNDDSQAIDKHMVKLKDGMAKLSLKSFTNS